MRLSSFVRLASGLLLLCAVSSFSGCEKTDVAPRKGCTKPSTTTSTDTTATGGAS